MAFSSAVPPTLMELPRLLVESEMRPEEKLRQLGRVCLLNAALGAEPGDCLFK